MGEIADQIIDQFLEEQTFSRQPYRPRKKQNFQDAGKGLWRSNEGILAISEMSDFHISNCIAICERYGNHVKLRELQKELRRRDATEPEEIPF